MKRILAALAAVLLTTGCADEKILEKVGFMRTIAFDTAGADEPDKLEVTISIPLSTGKKTMLHSTIARTPQEAMLVFNRRNDREIVKGQVRQVLFGESIARKGVWDHLDLLMRDPSLGSRVHLLVTEGDPKALLGRTFANRGTSGEYIDDLIRTVVHAENLPDTNYYDDGIEPIAMIIKGSATNLAIDGIALFRKDRMIARVKPEDQMLLSMLRDDVDTGKLFLELPTNGEPDDKVALSHLVSRRNVTVASGGANRQGAPLQATVRLTIKGSILEYSGDRSVQGAAEQRQLEAKMGEVIRQRCQSLIEFMQKNGTDAIGIGQYARKKMSYAEWTRKPWSDLFAKADIRVEAVVHIKDFGNLK
ncbi:Ger(x)C family spore germination protein [Paenibacillus ginsengarvi]|uniref:Ger(x)C family spore germination protein n=1 Tax=Paenibacillus ginsengarvi TaxID=400777 RepID=UPI0013152773|nr:Ger(x)C family spore germination protein [Paenibacillus ginsengarvi]